MLVLLAAIAWPADLTLDIEAVGGVVTPEQQLMLQTTLEHAADFLESDLGVTVASGTTIKVYVYQSAEAYDEQRVQAGVPKWASGFFRRRGDVRVAHLHATTPEEMRRTFLHEGMHDLLSTQRTPLWLNEGLSSVIAGASVAGTTMTIVPPARWAKVLAQRGRPRAADIVKSPDRWLETTTEEASLLYVSGWALTASLLSTPEGRATLSAVLAAYKQSGTAESVLAAMEDSYPGGMAGVESAFSAWASGTPATMAVKNPYLPEERSDAMWLSCGNGRLVLRELGCGK